MEKVPVLDIKQFNEYENAESFYANTLENHIITRHKDINHPHSHNFYLAVLFTHGTGTHEIDFSTYIVQPGALFFLNPGQTHNWELSTDTKGYIFLHTREFYELHYTHNRLEQFPFFYSMHNAPYLHLKDMVNVENLFRAILGEYHTSTLLKTNALLSLTDLLYIYSTRLYAQQMPVSNAENIYYNKFREFEALISAHFRIQKSPAAYASLLAITPRHLNRITQAVTGKTATDVILDRVLLEAKKELVQQKDSFANIALTLGYEDYAYFSRLFKNKTGETPSEFLNRYRK